MNEYRKSHVIEKNNIAGVRDVLKEIVARRTVLMEPSKTGAVEISVYCKHLTARGPLATKFT